MWRSAAQTLASAANMAFDSVDYDPNGNLTTGASAKYTCPVNGFYLVIAQWQIGSTANLYMSFLQILLEQNASVVRTWGTCLEGAGSSGNSLFPTVIGSGIVQCSAGDVLTMVTNFSGNLTPLNTQTGQTATFFEVCFLTPA